MPDMATFEMPKALKVAEDSASATYAKFTCEPLEKGFGHTLGNSLRRVLLSSLEGVAVTSIRIDGVAHEFTTIPDVVEDVTDVVLNFKKVLFNCSGELPRTLELRVHKNGAISAGQIQTDGVTSVLNPEQHLLTLDKPRDLFIEIEIDKGRGYRPADDNKRKDQPIGVIPIDSLFSPIRRIAYSIHDCRVGMRTDYDSLELEVWTDGRIDPREAVKHSAQILLHHLNIFSGVVAKDEDETTNLITSAEDEALLRCLLTPVNELELSVRAQNCLNNANIRLLGELVLRSEGEMMKYRNFGQKSLSELKEKLTEMDLHLGMELKEEVRLAFEKEIDRQRAGQGN